MLNCTFNSHAQLISTNFPRICSANYPGSAVETLCLQTLLFSEQSFNFTLGEIMRCFGKNTLTYIKCLADGHIDYLPRLPQHLLIHILRFLHLEDLQRVACLSKMFRKVSICLSVQDVQEGNRLSVCAS